MTTVGRVGRPRASSKEVIAEAACELFLEQGYEETSVADIASRAGVSRSSFFNYFDSKAAVLWEALDVRIEALEQVEMSSEAEIHRALVTLGEGFVPESLALALAQADAMGLELELPRELAVRADRIASIVRMRMADAMQLSVFESDVRALALAGAVVASLREWARRGAGTTRLDDLIREALTVFAGQLP